MSRKFLSLTAGALLSLGLAGTAFAAGPVTLTGAQMDGVTAGSGYALNLAFANANANAFGGRINVAATNTNATAGTIWCVNFASSSSTSIAASAH